VQRPTFASVQEYGRIFTNPDYWRPYVEEICARHGFGRCQEMRTGLPGTMPVFLVDERYVVKLFSDLFAGDVGFRVERELYELLGERADIPTPALLAAGTLFPAADGWHWPYLVSQILPGRSLRETAGRAGAADTQAVAEWLGPIVRRLHQVRPPASAYLRPTWEAFDRFLAAQRANAVVHHQQWQTLPERLIAQIDGYLPPLAELVDHRAAPHLLHGDLNADHVLGDFAGERWRPTAIIDFGDARVGDRFYELPALQIGLFHGDKHLLRAFLEAYGFDAELQRDFPRRAMSMTLLHEFNVLGEVLHNFPEAAEVSSLEELAALLWDLKQPGLAPRLA
jgi:hygromycin-B 7''-O-kinase